MATVAINLATGTFQQEEIIVGIDLGTTNSLVAYVHPDSRQPLAINDQGRGSIVPSRSSADSRRQAGGCALVQARCSCAGP